MTKLIRSTIDMFSLFETCERKFRALSIEPDESFLLTPSTMKLLRNSSAELRVFAHALATNNFPPGNQEGNRRVEGNESCYV